ncbi:hypothetical protein HKX48_002584 [Thoreauomyces humboldtii]|nr:hypothetical protein HKX48_002584 [Thoreauomyces humboldtii]
MSIRASSSLLLRRQTACCSSSVVRLAQSPLRSLSLPLHTTTQSLNRPAKPSSPPTTPSSSSPAPASAATTVAKEDVASTQPHAKRPHERARLAAFAARTGLVFSDPKLLRHALTHRSYAKAGVDPRSTKLESLGARVLELFVSEHLAAKYPKMPSDALASLVRAYSGDHAVQSVAATFGVPLVMLWKNTGTGTSAGSAPVSGSLLRSLIGALHTDRGASATRSFVQAHFLSRTVDVEAHLRLDQTNPMARLAGLVKSNGQIRPVSRLLQETGRLSSAPVFLVGVYSGVVKLGEGHGSSLRQAENRAAKDALCKHYLVQAKEYTVPSLR